MDAERCREEEDDCEHGHTADESPSDSLKFRENQHPIQHFSCYVKYFFRAVVSYLLWYVGPSPLLLPCSLSVSSTLLTHGEQEEKTWGEQRGNIGCRVPLGEEDI